ncbi:MAG: hypothetical protein ACREPT_09645, partial [Rudaea sp.]
MLPFDQQALRREGTAILPRFSEGDHTGAGGSGRNLAHLQRDLLLASAEPLRADFMKTMALMESC